MKILHISTLSSGGAGNVVKILDKALNEIVIPSNSIFQIDKGDDKNVFISSYLEKIELATKYYKNKLLLIGRDKQFEIFTYPDTSFDICKHHLVIEADLINLHWISHFVDYSSFFKQINKPVVWTLHDMNSFTGGCHYTAGCEKFKKACEICPQLEGTFVKNYAKNNFKIKQEALENFYNLNIVGVSSWISEEAKQSTLLKKYKHHVIHNGIDTGIYYPENKKEAKNSLNLPFNKKVIFYLAEDLKRKNKGFHLLKEALEKLDSPNEYILMVAGRGAEEIKLANKIEIKLLGFLASKDELRQAYSSADLTVIPSLYETFNQVTLESMACGTPALAWDNSGPKDIISHKETGYLAKAYDIEDMKSGIAWIFSNDDLQKSLCEKSHKRAKENFSQELQAERYKTLYNKILEII